MFQPLTLWFLILKLCCCHLVTKSCLTLLATPWVACRLLSPWNSPGKNTGISCHFLLQGIFLTQGSNPRLLPPGKFHLKATYLSLNPLALSLLLFWLLVYLFHWQNRCSFLLDYFEFLPSVRVLIFQSYSNRQRHQVRCGRRGTGVGMGVGGREAGFL